MLTIEPSADNQSTAISGRLDAAQAAMAQAALDKLQGLVRLDCHALEYLSSAGLGVLLKTQKRLLAGGGNMRLERVSPHLMDILRYSGFDQIFEISMAQR